MKIDDIEYFYSRGELYTLVKLKKYGLNYVEEKSNIIPKNNSTYVITSKSYKNNVMMNGLLKMIRSNPLVNLTIKANK